MGVIACYANDPTTAVIVLETIKAIAQHNLIVAEVYAFMAPGVPESSLPDFGLPIIRSALTAPHELGGLGLTEAQASPLLRASEQEDNIQPSDVERLFIIPPPPPEPVEPEVPVEPEPETPVDPVEPEPEPEPPVIE
jgi:outer membrane biosynthesis protein TonB